MYVFLIGVLCAAGIIAGQGSSLAGSAAPLTLRNDDVKMQFSTNDGVPRIVMLGASRNWAAKPIPETALPSTVEIDGRTVTVVWKHIASSSGKGSVSFTYRAEDPKLEAVSTWKAYPGPGPMEHSLVLRNLGDSAGRLTPTPSIALPLSTPSDHKLEYWWVNKGAGYEPMEGGTFAEAVTANYSKILHSGPYSSDEENRDAIPWFCLHDADGRHGIYGGIEFSGWVEINARRAKDGQFEVTMGFQPRDGKTKMILNPGGKLVLPTCFIGTYDGEVDDGCNHLHRWIEAHLRPPMPGGVTPVLVNNSWGSGMAVDETLAKKMMDDCADMGIEIFHVDAGWYKDVGNWSTNPSKFANGLEKAAEYAHAKGLRFGLWVGWTQGGSARNTGPEVLSVFSPMQKDWFGRDMPPDWHNWDFTGETLCLGSADARGWCLNQLRRMVKDFKLDLLEHDQPMILDDCNRNGHGHIAGDPVDVSRAACEGYYAVYDQLRKENPGLLFEDCVNGGRMVDFGVARRVHYICVTDSYDPWTNRRAFYDASYPLPPSMIELYLANVPGDTLASFRSMLRSAMLGWATIMIDTSQWTPEQHQAAKKEFACYKTELRPFIASADLYHLTPRPNGKRWEAYQYHDPKSGNGAMFVFRQGDKETETIRLKGLNPRFSYTARSTDGSMADIAMSGRQLMETGVTLRIADPQGSDMVFVDREQNTRR
jgi:alpha-galactosidase